MVNLLWAQGKVVLVEPYADLRIGKLVQMKVAKKYFKVPAYQFRMRFPSAFQEGTEVVVKSLTSGPVGLEKTGRESVIFATRVRDQDLSVSIPWMVQEYVDAELDVTVVFVRDQLFAFELDRRGFPAQVVDWRELPLETTSNQWRPHELPKEVEGGIFRLMDELMLHFGRLDFLLSKGSYYFLEVNPNGHWAWLDAEGQYGLLEKFTREISPLTTTHEIPNHHESKVPS